MVDITQLEEELKEIDNIIKTNGNLEDAKNLIASNRITIQGITETSRKRAYKLRLDDYEAKITHKELVPEEKKTTQPIDQTAMLADSLRTLKETEKTAQKITDSLEQQGETIQKIKGTSQKITQQVGQAQKMTNTIKKREHPLWWIFGRS